MADAAAQVGDPQIRHRGTIGGSLAHADPAADLPMTLLALGGSVEISGPSGVRVVGADDFFVGPFESALQPDELLTAVRVPRGWLGALGVRRSSSGGPTTGRSWASPSTTAGSRSPPWAAPQCEPPATERALQEGASIEEAAALAAEGTSPGYDFHADAEYRAHLARVLTERALEGKTG